MRDEGLAHSRRHSRGVLGGRGALAGQVGARLQEWARSPQSPPQPLTLLSFGRSGQAVGSSRLRSSPSRMDEDLSEFREKASVSASCTCREKRPPRVTRGAGTGQAWSPRKVQGGGQRGPETC